MIKGTKSWSGDFTIRKDADPNLSVGKVYWMETKEPTLIRPMTRMCWRVQSRTETEDGVRYELQRP